MGLEGESRDRILDRLDSETFDCAVIGGGITGAGIAREGALRGLRVALLEASDFAAGTSGRSSKLVHGGLRYLALGDIVTVRQTALERKRIHRLAPHLAEPRWMLVPVRSRAGLAKMRVGLTTYEKLGSVEEADLHHNWGGDELARGEPALNREAYPFACRYREYLTDDARLVLANLRAAAAAGAAVLNHASVDAIPRVGDRACGVEATCTRSGRRVRVRARCVINAAGPWVDAVRALEDRAAPPRLQLSKGVHVVLPRESLPVENICVFNTPDRRSIFAVPRGEVVYVGTTDTAYEGDTAWPPILRQDVEYLLAPLARYLSVTPPDASQVVAAWAGLRPLIAAPGKPPTEISRKDEVWTGPAGVVTIAGGKLTGYRPMARATLERAADEAGLRLREAPDEEPPLPGGDLGADLDREAAALHSEAGVPVACARRLVRLYGSESADVLALGNAPLCPEDPNVLSGEVDWAVAREGALDLEDLVYRRQRCALYDPAAREAVLEPAAARMATLLGWDAARRGAEVDAVRQRLADDLAFQKETTL
ncbi:MAG: glycerol-3-phosphate dehydrogenase/oxidase [Deltaproteobacteria bacterium]|nr:glycerol-3-phosphate dehydrogenase/oxidase [Deltaproteobacteria bacterium]